MSRWPSIIHAMRPALAVFGQLTDDCGGRGREKKQTLASGFPFVDGRRPHARHGPGWLNAVISDGRLDAPGKRFLFHFLACAPSIPISVRRQGIGWM